MEKTYLVEFELPSGRKRAEMIKAPNLEDATIEASNMAEEKNWEFLAIDEI